MGRWKPGDTGQRQSMATVDLERVPGRWSMHRRRGVAPFASSDPDTRRIWWSEPSPADAGPIPRLDRLLELTLVMEGEVRRASQDRPPASRASA